MAVSTAQQADLLFKLIFGGVSETQTSRQFFEEPYLSKSAVYPTQIWADYGKIPTTAPGGVDGATTGVVTRYIARSMAAVAGTTNSFYLALLAGAIPFNFGDGSYNYSLTDSTGTAIPFGSGDWVVDTNAGTLTFFNGTPANMPPKISFYAYAGNKGVASDTISETPLTLTDGTANQAVATISGATYKTVVFECQIYKTSSVSEICGYQRWVGNYKPITGAWSWAPMEQSGDDTTNYVLAMDNTGAIKMTTPLDGGSAYSCIMKFRARTFTA